MRVAAALCVTALLLWRLAAPRHTEHNRCCAPSRGILPVLQQNNY